MIMLIFVMGALLGVLGSCTGTGNQPASPPAQVLSSSSVHPFFRSGPAASPGT
jgi:hypothetical protein